MAQTESNKLHKELFRIVGVQKMRQKHLSKKPVSFWKEVFYRFSHNKLAIIGLIVLFVIH